MPGDDKFLAAREAFRVGEAARLEHMAEELKGNDLEPWAEYWQLLLAINRSADGIDSSVESFLSRHHGSYLAEKLRGDWLAALGKRAAWADFMAQYPVMQEPGPELTCHYWHARLALHDERGVLEDARDLWLSESNMPGACKPLVDRLVGNRQLQADDIWLRIRNLLEQTRYSDAQTVAAYLPGEQMPTSKALQQIAANPSRHLKKLPADLGRSRLSREATIFALLRHARKDINDAAEHWRSMEARFDADERSYVWGQLARRAALAHMSEALAWYENADQAGATTLSADQHAWRVRAALRTENWPAVLHAISHMPATLAAQPDWIYWRARALTESGRREESLALYRSICAEPGFYGVLAAEELGLPFSLPPRAAEPTAEELMLASANPGLRRALALFRLDMRLEGIREWNWTIRDMNDRELLAAAELARRKNAFDRAIHTAEKTIAEHNYTVRYLAPYRDTVSPRAQALALDDSWVYGLMRQESRFVTAARSGVGARGLMQVMPATAKMVARKIGLADYHPDHVDNMDTNVTLGTSYLKMVLESLDNSAVLACAAYNAGPGRAQRWRPSRAQEGAIYAETIPYSETRDYVKKVMTNSVYYSAVFEENPQTLKSRLGIIQPRPGMDAGSKVGR